MSGVSRLGSLLARCLRGGLLQSQASPVVHFGSQPALAVQRLP